MIGVYAIFVVGILRKDLRKKRKGETIVRASWDEYFMEIAEIVKTRATCLRRQVGQSLSRITVSLQQGITALLQV